MEICPPKGTASSWPAVRLTCFELLLKQKNASLQRLVSYRAPFEDGRLIQEHATAVIFQRLRRGRDNECGMLDPMEDRPYLPM
jgi:hypothetical protein